MNGREKKTGRPRFMGTKMIFFAMIAEMDLVVINLINIFFISHFLGAEGAAAYEVVMPCIMLVSAFAGREFILDAYKEAVKEKYRFFSFGDAMFIK